MSKESSRRRAIKRAQAAQQERVERITRQNIWLWKLVITSPSKMLAFKMPIKMTLKKVKNQSRRTSSSSNSSSRSMPSSRPRPRRCRSWTNNSCCCIKTRWIWWSWWIIRVDLTSFRISWIRIWVLPMVMNHRSKKRICFKVSLICS